MPNGKDFLPLTGLFLPLTGLFLPTTGLFLPPTGLFLSPTGLCRSPNGLFLSPTGLFLTLTGLLLPLIMLSSLYGCLGRLLKVLVLCTVFSLIFYEIFLRVGRGTLIGLSA